MSSTIRAGKHLPEAFPISLMFLFYNKKSQHNANTGKHEGRGIFKFTYVALVRTHTLNTKCHGAGSLTPSHPFMRHGSWKEASVGKRQLNFVT
jgi:hypothetical protein